MADHQGPRRKHALERRAVRLEALIECSRDPIWSVDLEFRLVTFNRAYAENIQKNWGVTAELGMRPADLAPESCSAQWPHSYEWALREGTYRKESQNGDGRWLELSFHPITIDGAHVGVSVFGKDITEQKLAKDRVETSEGRLSSYFNLQLMGMVVTSQAMLFLEVNDRACEILGYSREELLTMRWPEITHQDDIQSNTALLERMKAGDTDRFSVEKRFMRKDGSTIWTSVSVGCVRKSDGTLDQACAVLEDISERKAAEVASQKAEREYREIFEVAPEGIFKTDVRGKLLSLNPAGARMLGYHSGQEAVHAIQNLGKQVWLSPEERAQYLAELEARGEIHDRQVQNKSKDGTPIWVSLSARRVYGEDGKTQYYQGYFINLSEKKQMEAELSGRLREVKLMSEMNRALLNASSESVLLQEYCRIIVEHGGYRMAWVGFAEKELDRQVTPMAWFGHEDGYLSEVNVTWDGGELSRGPIGRAIRSRQIEVAHDFESDPGMKPFKTAAAKRGYHSLIAIPFRPSSDTVACLSAYGGARNAWSEAERRLMDQVASALGFGIKTLRTTIARDQYQRDLRVSLEQTIQVIAETVDQRDPYTAGHQRRVADLCVRIAAKMGLSEDRIHGLRLAASIHDLGKISIPLEFLSKPGLLTPLQYSLVKEHAQLGYEIVQGVHFPWPIAEMVLQHHEKMDGSGYPQGLTGDAMLLESRILAVADVVEAIATHRPYRASLGIGAAIEEIILGRGKHYDPDAVDACVSVFLEDHYEFPA